MFLRGEAKMIVTKYSNVYSAYLKYLRTIEEEITIVEAEHRQFERDEIEHYIPQYMKEIIAGYLTE
jgi:hypothetical protein